MAYTIPNYTELRAASAFSFLDGASHPEELADRAAELGQTAMALSDQNGVYAIPRFVKAAKTAGIRPIIGAKVFLDLGPAVPGKPTMAFLCKNAAGWGNLCELLTLAHAGHKKGEAVITLDALDRYADGLVVLAGGLDGPILSAAKALGPQAAHQILDRIVGTFGPTSTYLDLQRHGIPLQEHGNRLLTDLANSLKIKCIATNDVRYALPEQAEILDVFTALRHKTTLDQAKHILPQSHRLAMASCAQMNQLFCDRPDVLRATADLAASLDFSLDDTGYRFPRFSATGSFDEEADLLRARVAQGMINRYGSPSTRAKRQAEHELSLISELKLAGYFLLVDDIVHFCRINDILAQGRGSAANSIVCYALGITAIDPIAYDLLFERFLSKERGEWPDIDLDLPSGDNREKVIQYVYERYGASSVGMTASVITYQGRLASREIGKVMGLDLQRLDRLGRLIGHFEFRDAGDGFEQRVAEAGFDLNDSRVQSFMQIWNSVLHLPRHLAQHNGGMVISEGRLDRTVPLEPARMENRMVIQWDKDDLADLRIIKVDLLGLGMLNAIHQTLELVKKHHGVEIDLGRLPPDDKDVYAMLQRADTIGVFQIESRAQMATLPRMKPSRFYDLVVEVALIRPGPIVGKMVHPYLARRTGREPVVYDDPLLEPILKRTLGVPLFQEQLMKMAMAVAGFTGGQAEELRRAMGSKRSRARMKALTQQLIQGMQERGIGQGARDRIVQSIESFALYGFPESHAASFALIAYASAWLKFHYPGAFYAALLNSWPMGFYHPSTLTQDATRHGVSIKGVDVNHSLWDCSLEDEGQSIRIGLKYVKGLSKRTGDAIVATQGLAPFTSVTELGRKTGASSTELYALAKVGALGPSRREAMWQALALRADSGLLAGAISNAHEPALPAMNAATKLLADYEGVGLTTGKHPMVFLRSKLSGVVAASDIAKYKDGQRIWVAGIVIVRQRPRTAKGFVFLTLEDETGLANLVIKPDMFQANRALLSTANFLLVDGQVQNREGVVNVSAIACYALAAPVRHDGRNFH